MNNHLGKKFFYNKFKENIEKWDLFPKNSQVLVWYSGGKDSCTLLDLLVRLKEERNIKIDAYLVAIPHMVYRSDNPTQQQAVSNNFSYWESRGIKIQVLEPEFPDGRKYKNDDELDNGPTKCYVCGKIKAEHTLNQIIKIQTENFTVATPHSTYDMLGYIFELFHLCGGLPNGWKDISKGTKEYDNVMKLSARCYPKIIMNGAPIRASVRPLIDIPSTYFKPYIDELNIPIIPECCSNIGGEQFTLFKRTVMKGADIFMKNYKYEGDQNQLSLNYNRLIELANSSKVLAPIDVIIKSIPSRVSY